jgi:hypothetical protein
MYIMGLEVKVKLIEMKTSTITSANPGQ